MSTQTWCGTCLSRGRRVSPLGEARFEHIFRNIGQCANRARDVGAWLSVCWECRARIDKSLLFCERVRRAQSVCMGFAGQNLSSISTLRAVLKVGYDYEFTSESHKVSIQALDSTEVEVPSPSLIKEEFEGHSTTVEDLESLIDIAEMKLEPNGGFNVIEYKQAPLEFHVNESSTNIGKPTECISTVNSIETIGFEKEPSLSDVPEDASKEGPVERKIGLNELCEETLLQIRHPRQKPEELLAKWREHQVEVIHLSEEQQLEELEERRRAARQRGWSHMCDQCGVGFHEEESIEKHNEVHDEARGPYECNICHVRFARPHQLTSHARGHRRRWRCLRCGESIPKSVYIAPHHARCTGSAPVTCDLCGKSYSNNLRLRTHISKYHNAKRKYICDVCGSAFKEKQRIKYHMRMHTREMPYTCALCGKRSATSTTHHMHMLVHTPPENKSPETYCVECDCYFKNKNILRMHYKQSLKHVSKDTFRHACSECEERFPIASALRVHMNTSHLNNRTHQCNACDKAYYTQKVLNAHIKDKHSAGERTKDHLCPVCNRCFGTNSKLKAHSRIHTKERPYACLLCPATFSFNSTLYTHNKLKHKMTTAELKTKLGIKKI